MSGYGKAREDAKDPREATGPKSIDPDLMCRVEGCPNRWSVHRDGWQPLCSAHAWAHPKAWPRITQEQVEWVEQHQRYGETMAAQRASSPPVPRRAPQAPQSSSRAWRALHGVVEDIETDREGA